MNDVVQPVTVDPYVTQDSIRFSKLVVDIVQGKDTLYHVMYIGTGKSMRASNSSSCLLVDPAALEPSCEVLTQLSFKMIWVQNCMEVVCLSKLKAGWRT